MPLLKAHKRTFFEPLLFFVLTRNDPIIEHMTPVAAMAIGTAAPLSDNPAAIARAIYNATGVRLKQLPITPEKVLKALGRI